jgi:carbon monoxide dehydrogenase subunit G
VRLEVSVEAAAPQQVVWDVLTHWERQSEWMLDAKSVEVLTPERTGVGVTIRCPTNLLGVTVEDVMRVTAWQEPSLLAVTHLGRIITGSGAFELVPLGADRTRIDWWEEVEPPFGAVGELGANVLVLPVLRRIFTRSLTNLADLAARAAAEAT